MKGHRKSRITLRSYKGQAAPLPKVDSKLILDTRKKLRCSRAVFARRLLESLSDCTVARMYPLGYNEND